MPRRTQNLYSMARGRVRASMNKYNLFNLYKKSALQYKSKSIFQQKWLAKQETRAYHGEHLTEGRFKTVFDSKLESVAQLDASLKGISVEATPVVLQTYAALEKRLEFALFRAMFASSIRQAREFIMNGHVKVNGVTVKHSSYPLKSGDVFSVTPDRVMLAMGKGKPSLEKAIKTDNRQIAVWNKYVAAARESPRDVWELKQARPESLNTLSELSTQLSKEAVRKFNDFVEKNMLQQQKDTTRETILSQILASAKGQDFQSITPELFKNLGNNAGKCMEVYRLLKEADHALVKSYTPEECKAYISTKSTEFASVEEGKRASSIKKILLEIVSLQLEYLRVASQQDKLPDNAKTIPFTSDFGQKMNFHPKLNKEAVLEKESSAYVRLPWQKGLFGRQNPKKPYFTPWTPRPFIGAFAILPSHIEISFETCHAVYLRDPVARPGHSEVITPFAIEDHQRAYMYYARKGM